MSENSEDSISFDLSFDPEQMRALGHQVVDLTIDHILSLRDRPAISVANNEDLRAQLGGPAPQDPGDMASALNLLSHVALENQQHGDHPRYFARVPSPSSFAAIAGDWLATGMDSVASSWGGGSGPSAIELITLEWLRDQIGLNPVSEGIMLSGGSMASVTALIVARNIKGEGCIYLSDQTHSSIVRGISAIGIPDALVRVIPTDENFTIDVARLRDQIAVDKASGLTPTVVIATAGTTNTGAVDDLAAIAEISESEGMWFHVDGAYGGPAALTGHGKSLMTGLERANSFVLDPHKWLFSPYDIACLWVSTSGVLEETFAMYPEYLKDVSEGTVNFHNRSLELSRRSRAIKLWLTIRTYGFIKISAAIERGVVLAEYAQSLIEQTPDLSVVTPAQLGIVTFRFNGSCDHAAIARELTETGFAALTTTSLKGQEVLRLCIINPATTESDISETLSRLVAIYSSRVSSIVGDNADANVV